MIKGFKDSDINNAKNKSARLKNSLEVYFREALNLQKSGELIKASKIYDLLIQNNYDHEDILINYANICQKLNEDNKAILLFKKSISKNPKNFVPFFKMGFILNNNGRYFEALEFAKKAIELKPELWQGIIIL